jgi:hypothetical protein
VIVDLSEYAQASKFTTKRFPLKKTKAPFLTIEIKAEWVRIDNKNLVK